MIRHVGAGEVGVNGVHIHPREHLGAEAPPVEAEAVHPGIHHDVAAPALAMRAPQGHLLRADEHGVRVDRECGGKIGGINAVQYLYAKVRRVAFERRRLLPVGDVDRSAAFRIEPVRHGLCTEAVAVCLYRRAGIYAGKSAKLSPVGCKCVEIDAEAEGRRRDHM